MFFWLALSDVAPALAFACVYLFSDEPGDKCSRTGLRELMFVAAIACRLCSLAYHVAAHAQWHPERLFYVDLIGICTNALGVPYSVLCHGEATARYSEAQRAFFVAWVLAAYMACVATFACGAMGLARIDYRVQQGMIVALAVAGSLPCAAVSGSLVGPVLFAAGYALFYVGRFPERFVASVQPGAALHSHVLWHWASAAGQFSFLVA